MNLCFDIFKSNKITYNNFYWDIKLLYNLRGYRFNDLEDLSKQILEENKIENYIHIKEKLKAHIKSYKNSKINIGNFKKENLFPVNLIEEHNSEKDYIISELFNNFKWEDIKEYYVDFFYDFLKPLFYSNLIPLYRDNKPIFVHINPIGAKTGRMSNQKGTFNIYNISKEKRKEIFPMKDNLFVQIDYKSFQPRLAIFSTDNEEFKNKFKDIEDIYSIFSGDRNKNKIAFLAWMFSDNGNDVFEQEAYPIV